MDYIAHVKPQKNSENSGNVHKLEDHLRKTAILAAKIAPEQSEDWTELTGRWHDLGKFRNRFQDYIRIQTGFEQENAHIENGIRAPHSTAGAIYAVRKLPVIQGHIIAYMIAGHHAGLPDWSGGRGSLSYRLIHGEQEFQESLQADIPDDILNFSELKFPDLINNINVLPLWIRIMFSCLVDADFRDTESFMVPEKAQFRNARLSVLELYERFEEKMAYLHNNTPSTVLNSIRNEILESCNKAAELSPGLFSLTVPTGGGKTLSSLSFALRHANKHNKRRIIYAIPFTSIIEQNAAVFRDFLGEDAVLEHHCNFDIEPEKEDARARLATENWEAPLIVTTNVQLFESLFASRTTKCRKLHNIVNSVIILDEAQQIPRDFHAPITQVMQQLTDYFGVTWVLCTATQPDLSAQQDCRGRQTFVGLKDIHEIIADPFSLAEKLKRVDIELPAHDSPVTSWSDLASQLNQEDSVLAIVNTRKNAKELYEKLINDGNNLHLSANMCAEHRSQVIQEIKARLKARRQGDKRPLRVISTQLIEAGVDVDFPVVYRSMAGLDSIAQAAGRCNREGKLPNLGRVKVFKPEQASPPGFLRQGESATISLLASGLLDDPLAPKAIKQYFKQLNIKGSRDKHGVLSEHLKVNLTSEDEPVIQFRTAAKKFRLIDDNGISVVVPFKLSKKIVSPIEDWIHQLEQDSLEKSIYRKLQRFTISLPEQTVQELIRIGAIEQRVGLNVLLSVYYDGVLGVVSPHTNFDGVI